MDIITHSVLTCPRCGERTAQNMPADACVFFFECEACHSLLRPKQGDCCVFCSYGSVKCLPVQRQDGCCRAS